jgi:tRNA(fMet)-specific endonuclease VapC
MAAVTPAELLLGLELAGSRKRGAREKYVRDVLRTIPIEPYDLEVAKAHAQLLAHARRTGQARGAHDLIIAATALATRRMVVTGDVAGFAGLPGVAVKPA